MHETRYLPIRGMPPQNKTNANIGMGTGLLLQAGALLFPGSEEVRFAGAVLLILESASFCLGCNELRAREGAFEVVRIGRGIRSSRSNRLDGATRPNP